MELSEFVVSGGYVLTMDPAIGDLPVGDVHIRDGEIVEVGVSVCAPAATRIDAAGKVVLPGLIETHWHMWNNVLRGLSDGRDGARGYFAMCAALAPGFTPADNAAGVAAACAEAIDSGFTTVHNWSHNLRSPEHAGAEIEALRASGLRARFSYGWLNGLPSTGAMDLDDLAACRRRFPAHGLVTLGMAARGVGGSSPARVPVEIYRSEIETARDLGLPVSVHASGSAARPQIAALEAHGLLGPDLQIVHAVVTGAQEIAALARAGCTVSLSPYTELLIGYGFPPTTALLDAGIATGLSVDTTALAGNADPFSIMKLALALANGQATSEFALAPRRVLELATIEGARSLGIDQLVGSLSPGKRADLIVVALPEPRRQGDDPARGLVTATQPCGVETSVVEGRVLKRAGKLTTIDPTEVGRAVQQAQTSVLAHARW